MKNKKMYIAYVLAALLVIIFIIVLLPPAKRTLGDLYGVDGTYTARFKYRGQWYDFNDRQYQSFDSLLGEELKRGFTGNIGHSTTGDDVTIEITGDDGKVQRYSLIGNEIRYNDFYVYTPTDKVVNFIKTLPANVSE